MGNQDTKTGAKRKTVLTVPGKEFELQLRCEVGVSRGIDVIDLKLPPISRHC